MTIPNIFNGYSSFSGNGELQWCFSQVKGTIEEAIEAGEQMLAETANP